MAYSIQYMSIDELVELHNNRGCAMGHRIVVAAALIVIGMRTSTPASAEQIAEGAEHCVVNLKINDILNLRADPTSASPTIARLPHNGCGVIVTGQCNGDWCPVEANHHTGWVHRRYISLVSPSLYCVSGVAAGDMLNLRAWPSPQSKVVIRLKPNQCDIAFLPYATNGWQKVRAGGVEGWVNRSYVSGQ